MEREHRNGIILSKQDLPFPIFGRPLIEIEGQNGKPPDIVMRCIEFLQLKANIEEEGILRLSGSKTEIENLRSKFDRGELVFFKGVDALAVTGLLKYFFREIPGGLIPQPFSEKISTTLAQQLDPEITANISEELLHDSIRGELKNLLSEMPKVNCETLKILAHFFEMVTQHSAKNKMNLHNILTCFVPSLDCPPGLLKYCVEDYEIIFGK